MLMHMYVTLIRKDTYTRTNPIYASLLAEVKTPYMSMLHLYEVHGILHDVLLEEGYLPGKVLYIRVT